MFVHRKQNVVRKLVKLISLTIFLYLLCYTKITKKIEKQSSTIYEYINHLPLLFPISHIKEVKTFNNLNNSTKCVKTKALYKGTY